MNQKATSCQTANNFFESTSYTTRVWMKTLCAYEYTQLPIIYNVIVAVCLCRRSPINVIKLIVTLMTHD